MQLDLNDENWLGAVKSVWIFDRVQQCAMNKASLSRFYCPSLAALG